MEFRLNMRFPDGSFRAWCAPKDFLPLFYQQNPFPWLHAPEFEDFPHPLSGHYL